jgi:hypothetical protein
MNTHIYHVLVSILVEKNVLVSINDI